MASCSLLPNHCSVYPAIRPHTHVPITFIPITNLYSTQLLLQALSSVTTTDVNLFSTCPALTLLVPRPSLTWPPHAPQPPLPGYAPSLHHVEITISSILVPVILCPVTVIPQLQAASSVAHCLPTVSLPSL